MSKIQALRATAGARPPPAVTVPFATYVHTFVIACWLSAWGTAMARALTVATMFGTLCAAVGDALGAVCMHAMSVVAGGLSLVMRPAISAWVRARGAAAAVAHVGAAILGNCLPGTRSRPRPSRGGSSGSVRRRPRNPRSKLLTLSFIVFAAAAAAVCVVWRGRPAPVDPLVAMLRDVGSDAPAAINAYKQLRIIGESPIAGNNFTSGGGVSIVVAHLARFAANAELVELACGVLANVAVYDDTRSAVVDEGGIGAILTSFENHPKSAGIVMRGIEALSNLVATKSFVPAVVPALPLMVTLLRRHAASPDVAERLSNALMILVMYSDPGADALVAADGVPLLLRVMRLHDGNLYVLNKACLAMGYVAAKGGVGHLAAAGASSAVTVALRSHGSDVTLVHAACFFLANTASVAIGVKAVVRVGGIELLLAALAAHAGDHEIVSNVCTALHNIIMVDPSRTMRLNISSAGGVALLRATVRGDGLGTNVPQVCHTVYKMMPYSLGRNTM